MSIRWLPALAAALIMLVVTTAGAQAQMFGNDEKIHYLQDVEVKSQDGEDLFLGYKTTTMYLIAGVSISDDGYVFGLRDDRSKFILTTPEEIAGFQAQGLLPDPLPSYQIGLVDYILGYSLWTFVLPLVVIVFLVTTFRKKRTLSSAAPGDAPSS